MNPTSQTSSKGGKLRPKNVNGLTWAPLKYTEFIMLDMYDKLWQTHRYVRSSSVPTAPWTLNFVFLPPSFCRLHFCPGATTGSQELIATAPSRTTRTDRYLSGDTQLWLLPCDLSSPLLYGIEYYSLVGSTKGFFRIWSHVSLAFRRAYCR